MFSPGRLILPCALLSLLGASCLANNKDPVIEIFKRSLAEKSNSEIINNPSVEEGTVQHVSEFIKERARRDSSSRVRRSGLFDDENVEWSINGQKINFTKPRSTTPTPSIFDDNDFSSHHGFNNNGFSSQGFGTPGFGSQGFGSHGFGSQGYNPQGYNPQGYNPQGYNPQGYNPQGYNQQGYNPQRYDSQGHLINGQYPYNFNNQGGYLYPTTTKKPDPFKDFNDRVDNMNRKYTTGDLDVSKYMPNMNDFKF